MRRPTITLALVLLAAAVLTGGRPAESTDRQPESSPGITLARAPAETKTDDGAANTRGAVTVGQQEAAPLYNLDWYSVNGGGATDLAGTHFNLGLSVGQSAAGAVDGTHFDLGVGFWYGTGTACLIQVEGDVNDDGVVNAADIIKLVVFVFKSGPFPEPCVANGDVNCSGAVTAADIIYLVMFVFKGGTPPCDICNDPGAMICVPGP